MVEDPGENEEKLGSPERIATYSAKKKKWGTSQPL